MLKLIRFGQEISKEDYESGIPDLRTQLILTQNELLERKDFSVILVIGGVDAAGKGETINVLHEWMDSRYMQTHAFDHPTDEEAERPLAWRYWRVLPPKGRIGIYFGSWYTEALLARAKDKISDDEFQQILEHIKIFEKQLTDDGTLLLKYWFHISKKVQKKRLKKYSADPDQRWRVTDQDWWNLKRYDRLQPMWEQAIRETASPESSWLVVEGTDHRYRELTVGQELLQSIRGHMDRFADRVAVKPSPAAEQVVRTDPAEPTVLSQLDLSQNLAKDEYKERLAELQRRANRLAREAHRKGLSTVMAFEGWDAAGKGGAIRRLTTALDARRYETISVAAPTDEEKARHYLWRFWRNLPRAGHMTIFDRTWYGRVLVERVEGFATEAEWQRAYDEINDFEELLCEHGIVLLKFWLHIDSDEQLRRFQAREKTPYKKYKITREDYRNREKWSEYEAAVDEMVRRTSTRRAPWTLVESNDKRFARCKVLETVCERLQSGLENRR